MKKLSVSLLLLTALAACTKEKQVSNESVTESTDSTAVAATPAVEIKEYTVAQVSDLVKPKQNDTIYVTNFWASWCGPCVHEIPYFKEKMEEMKGQPVKFTFVNLDEKEDWSTEVKSFAAEHGISANTVLLDGTTITGDFFTNNFKTWDGGAIPFTIIQKGNKSDETLGGISKEMLSEKIAAVSN